MFDIGFWELSLIFVVALLVVGPQRLPGLVRSAAYWFSRIRQMTNDVKTEISMELEKAEQLKRLMDEQADVVKKTEQEFNAALNADIEKAGKLDPADSAAAKQKQAEPSKSEAAEDKPHQLEAQTGADESAEEPVMRPRPVPASMTPPKPAGHGRNETTAESDSQTAKDESKS